MDSRISVIIPVFNRCHLLPKALDSVISQSLQPAQIIVIDDGSTDGTAEMLARDYPGVDYHFQDNRGVSSARNLGIQCSRHDLIAFLDSDDEWLPAKLERQIQKLAQNPGIMLCHTNEIWIRNGRRVNAMNKHEKSGGYIFAKCLPLCAISPSSVLINRKLLDEVGGFDESLPACEDYDLWLRICAIHPVLYIDEPLLRKYGGHSDQLSRKHWGMDRFRVAALEKVLASKILSEEQARSTRHMLVKKCLILASGASKRGKSEQANFYQQKINDYES